MDNTQAQQQFKDFVAEIEKMKQENPEEYLEFITNITDYYKAFGEALEEYTKD